jgi:hypothetical protein
LIDAGFEIFVERDEQRIFDDSEYEASVPSSIHHRSNFNTLLALEASSLITIHGPPPRCLFLSLG